MQEYFPTVVQVMPQTNYTVQVFFDDGKIVEYDASNDLQGEVFQPLKNLNIFMDTCTVMNDTLSWDITGQRDPTQSIDIDPLVLYELPAINHKVS